MGFHFLGSAARRRMDANIRHLDVSLRSLSCLLHSAHATTLQPVHLVWAPLP